MIRQRQYYTLMSSLPWLPYFERAERLPINAVRLAERLSMLEPDDRMIIDRTLAFLDWQKQPIERTDAQVAAFFQDTVALTSSHPLLLQMIEYRMNERTLMAALRRRHKGLPAPEPPETWGVGPWVQHIERHWEESDFRLALMFPWLPQARQYLAAGETLALERLLMGLIWRQLERLTPDMFSFEAVLAYLFKWDILQRWLSYNRDTAHTRFDALVTEILGEHDQLFNIPT